MTKTKDSRSLRHFWKTKYSLSTRRIPKLKRLEQISKSSLQRIIKLILIVLCWRVIFWNYNEHETKTISLSLCWFILLLFIQRSLSIKNSITTTFWRTQLFKKIPPPPSPSSDNNFGINQTILESPSMNFISLRVHFPFGFKPEIVQSCFSWEKWKEKR